MNWYRYSQSFVAPYDRSNFKTIMEVGHNAYFGEEEECTEMVWVWKDGVIETHDARPDKRTKMTHHDFWARPSLFFRGRYDDCGGTKKVSVSVSEEKYNVYRFDLPQDLLKALESKFGNDITVYPMSGDPS